MANPQKENGYTAIANDIMEALAKTRIAGEYRQVLDFIMRKTYGYSKKDDKIALSQFADGTGLKKSSICRAIKILVNMNIISENAKAGDVAKTYKLQKDFDNWKPLAKKLTHNSVSDNAKKRLRKRKKSLAITDTTITNNKKQYIQKQGAVQSTAVKENLEIPEIIKAFELVNPACKKYYGNTTQRQACDDLIKTYGFERVMSVIEKTLPKTNGMTYFPTITTPVQLFEKWANLESKIRQYQSEKVAKDNKYKVI